MTINELSDFIGFNTSKIRYYEKELAIPTERDTRGRRKYTENTIKVFLEIKALTSRGLKLEEVKNTINIDTLILSTTSSDYPKIEVIQESNNNAFNNEEQERLYLITRPFELQVKQQQERIERLLDKIEVLQEEKIKIKEEYSFKISDLLAQNRFYDLQIKEYKEKLENKRWWKFWQKEKVFQ